MPSQIGYFDTLKSVAGKVFAYLASITLTGTDGKTITVTQDTSLDEAVAMSSKAPKASPVFTGDVTLAGEVVNSTLPAFLVRPTSPQENIANDNSNVTIIWGTEIKDQGGNFASNAFTAPVVGMYHFSVVVILDNVDSVANYIGIVLVTSNRSYPYWYTNPVELSGDAGYVSIAFSVDADMDAADTAHVTVNQQGGTAQMDIDANSSFSGYLVC